MKCLIATLNVRLIWKDSSTATLMNCPFIIEWSYTWIRSHGQTLSSTVPQSIPGSQHRWGRGAREQMVWQGRRCVSYHVSYLKSPLTCQVHVRESLSEVSLKMLCQVALGTREYVWSSHMSWLLNVWDQSGISWRKDVSILSLFATMPKQGSCCMYVCVHTYRVFSQSTFFFLMQ